MTTQLLEWKPGVGLTTADGAHNYQGQWKTGYFLAPCQRNDHSTVLEKVNFVTCLRWLKEASSRIETHTFDHWYLGSVTQILIPGDDTKAIEEAKVIKELLEHYPCLDDDTYSTMREDNAGDLWKSMRLSDRVDIIRTYGKTTSIFAARKDTPPLETGIYEWLVNFE